MTPSASQPSQPSPRPHPALGISHLYAPGWQLINTQLVAKAISELAHELVLQPQQIADDASGADGWPRYRLAADDAAIEYRFCARVQSLDHWQLDAASLRRHHGAEESLPDAMQFVVDLRGQLALSEQVLPEYLQEIASTLYAGAYKLGASSRTSPELAAADFQTVESELFLGHPVFIANRGRIGFDVADYAAYAPEAAAPLRLVWLAARAELTARATCADLSWEQLVREELGEPLLAAIGRFLAERDLSLDGVTLLPVHPWQWKNRLAQLFAGDLANGDLVFLGDLTALAAEAEASAEAGAEAVDRYRPQQSIRTFFNVTSPHKRYVKTSLSVLNMGFTRGIPSALVRTACATNDWVRDLVQGDPYLARLGFKVLREVAIATYRHRGYERASALRSDAYKEMLGAQWRESPIGMIERGQRVMSMAALLHVDRDGAALVAELVRRSGIGVDAWVRRYLDAYLKPQLHCFYAHRLVFTPHCENVLLVLEGDVVHSTILKDLAEDVGVLNPVAPLPEAVRHLALAVPDELLTLSIFTDVFDGVFRFLAQLLSEQAGCAVERFWCLVADCIVDYQRAHPHLEAELRRFDLFAPTFLRNCLNRLQLTNNRLMVDLNAPNPVESLQFRGDLPNPIAAYAAQRPTARAQEPAR